MEHKTQNIAGQVFQFDLSGDLAMKAYLADIEQSLNSNTDKMEILNDFRARIAENLKELKDQAITAELVEILRKEMGGFDEYNSLEQPAVKQPTVANLSGGFGISRKVIIITAVVALILLILSCIFVASASTVRVPTDTPLSWFYNSASDMKNWFYTQADEMQAWFYKQADEMSKWFYQKSDEMDQRYQEKSDNILNDFYEQRDKMDQDYQTRSDNMQQELLQKQDEMLKEFEKNIPQ